MSGVETRARDGVERLGGGFMISRYTKAAAAEHGLVHDIWSAYFVGRFGVLGPVHEDVVVAAAAFFPPEVAREAWRTGCAAVSPEAGARRYAEACHEWGRARLAGFEGAGRLAELAERVADHVDVAALPLFAAWRALPRPADGPARAAHALQVLREHRGGAHAVAVVSVGLSPRQAVLAGRGGEGNATFFGWPPPYEDVSSLAGLRARAEEITDAIVAPAYVVLAPGEQEELVDLLEAALAHVAVTR